MVDTQHFCLRWNNYQSSITSAFENLRDDEDFVDVTLACDGKSLKAHRVVLSACSPYFRELLKVSLLKSPLFFVSFRGTVRIRFTSHVKFGSGFDPVDLEVLRNNSIATANDYAQ